MQEVRLRKKGSDRPNWPYVHGVKDYRKVLNFVVDRNWIDKTPVCTAFKGNCEPHCLGFCPDSSGRCVFQSSGIYRTECHRGKL